MDRAIRNILIMGAAGKANQEEALSRVLFASPGTQQFHPSACKGWAKGQFTTVPLANYNCSSMTDIGAGLSEFDWDVDFSSADYGVVATGVLDPTGASSGTITTMIRNSNLTAGTTRVDTIVLSSFAPADVNFCMCAAFGDQ